MKHSFKRLRPWGRFLVLAMTATITIGPSGLSLAATLDDAVAYYRQGAFEDAAPILEQLADAGDPAANFWLGSMWHQGRGKPVNFHTAYKLYRTAAYHGNADAQNNLGLLYRDGEGVEQSDVVSYAWFSLAAAQDNPTAKRNLDRLSGRMEPAEILGGQQLAVEYLEWIGRTRNTRRTSSSEHPATAKSSAIAGKATIRSTNPGAKTTPKVASISQDQFIVQLGLFRSPSGIKRLESNLNKYGIRFVNQPISIAGTRYQRIRVGPFVDLKTARQTARRINEIFRLNSAVIPIPS
jgi:hypothetical protein